MPDLWNLLVIEPMVNSMLFLYQLLFNNLVLTIVVFTAVIRAVTYPLQMQSQRSMKAMQEMQQSDEFKKLQAKYANDKEKMQMEQFKLMQAKGVNPYIGCLPMLVQFPIIIGMYQAITTAVAATPAQLLTLSTHIYPVFSNIGQLIPLQHEFFWLNLGLPDPFFVMPVLVIATSWVQSRIMTPPSADPQQAQMSQTMALTSTVMFGYFSFTFASGLSIYFIVSNAVSILQYALTNQVNWRSILSLRSAPLPQPEPAKGGRKKAK